MSALSTIQEEKYKPVLEEAMLIKQRTNRLVHQVDRLKQEIIAKADGLTYDPNVHILVRDIKNKNNINAAAEVMLSKECPDKADSLKVWVDDYRCFMLSHVDSSEAVYKHIMDILSTDDVLSDNEKYTWGEALFTGIPVVGTIALMSKLQTDIRNAEANIIERMVIRVNEINVSKKL